MITVSDKIRGDDKTNILLTGALTPAELSNSQSDRYIVHGI